MKWNSMVFITTKTSPLDLPTRPHAVEVAMVGRSNAGKSSLLNALSLKPALAKVSKTPGKTRHLNLFYVGDHLSLVDLPGYGYAQRSKEEQQDWSLFIEKYLKERPPLKLLILVVDGRRTMEEEERMIEKLSRALDIRLLVVVNKCDKLNQSELHQAESFFQQEGIEALFVSCRTGRSIERVRKAIEEVCKGGSR